MLYAHLERINIVASKSSQNSLVQFTGTATMNKEIYTDILHCLRDADRRKCLEKWRINSWFLLHDNAPSTPVSFG